MYRAFAHDQAMRINLGIRRRLAPLLGNDRRSIQLMTGLLFSLPGTPVIYYGDEIGMGDNVFLGDRNGVRTPCSGARPQRGVLAGEPAAPRPAGHHRPEYHYESLNVEAQQQNPNSLLWWTKRLVALRKRFQASAGARSSSSPRTTRTSLAFIRQHEDETVLVVANLSRRVQYVELKPRLLQGRAPLELFGQTTFSRGRRAALPAHPGRARVLLFSLEEPRPRPTSPARRRTSRRRSRYRPASRRPRPTARCSSRCCRDTSRAGAGSPAATATCPACGCSTCLRSARCAFAVVRMEFTLGEPEEYVVPLPWRRRPRRSAARTVAAGGHRAPPCARPHRRTGRRPDRFPAPMRRPSAALLEAVRAGGAQGKGLGPLSVKLRGEIPRARSSPACPGRTTGAPRSPTASTRSSSCTAAWAKGVSPELELNRCLSERAPELVPPLLGSVEYRPGRSERSRSPRCTDGPATRGPPGPGRATSCAGSTSARWPADPTSARRRGP